MRYDYVILVMILIGFALDIEDLHDEFMFTGSDNKDCEEAYNCYDEVSKLKNKVDYYMDQISKSE